MLVSLSSDEAAMILRVARIDSCAESWEITVDKVKSLTKNYELLHNRQRCLNLPSIIIIDHYFLKLSKRLLRYPLWYSLVPPRGTSTPGWEPWC